MTTRGVPSIPNRRAALLLATALVALAGCGLFETREPEQPGDPENCPHHTANLPDSVVFNFSIGFSCKTFGDEAIRSALADSFSFVLHESDWPAGQPVSLTRTETATGLASFFGSVVMADSVAIGIDLHLGKDRGENGDNWLYEDVPYRVKSYSLDGKEKQRLCAGAANLHFKRQGVLWAIYRWIDGPSDETPDYSRMTLGARILPGSGHGTR